MSKKNLFISWSGELSKHIADELKLFFEETLQHIIPFFSPDIQKGTLWLESINSAIDNSSAGILCLTKENHTKPWVLFESGALSRVGVVCPIVFGMKKEDLKSPLNIFQASEFTAKEFKKLFEDVSHSSGANLNQKIIDRIFENKGRFDNLKKRIDLILETYITDTISSDETLTLLKDMNSKLDTIVEGRSNNEIDLQYFDLLIDNFQNLIQKVDVKSEAKNKETIQNIGVSIDYIISKLSDSVSIDSLIDKNEKLNEIIEAL